MKKFYYYAKLNDNQICIEIVSRVNKLTDVTGYIEIPEYNETLRYKKWLGNQWSQETYEPLVDTVIQDKLIILEESNEQLQQETLVIKGQNNMLEGMLMEMMIMLETLTTQGGLNNV